MNVIHLSRTFLLLAHDLSLFIINSTYVYIPFSLHFIYNKSFMGYYLVKVIWMHINLNGRTGLLTREGTSSGFPSGADFSRVNRVCLCLFSCFSAYNEQRLSLCPLLRSLPVWPQQWKCHKQPSVVWGPLRMKPSFLREEQCPHPGMRFSPAWGPVPRTPRGDWLVAGVEARGVAHGTCLRTLAVKGSGKHPGHHLGCSTGKRFKMGKRDL